MAYKGKVGPAKRYSKRHKKRIERIGKIAPIMGGE